MEARVKINNVLMDFFLTTRQLFTSQDINWWTGVVWITCGLLWCFISCLDSHSDGTHSLQRIHWWAVMECYISLNLFPWRNKLIYILDSLRVSSFQQIFIFGWTIPLKETMTSYHTIIHYMKLLMAANLCQYAFTTAHIHRNSDLSQHVWTKNCG